MVKYYVSVCGVLLLRAASRKLSSGRCLQCKSFKSQWRPHLGDYRSTILDDLLRDAYGLSNIRSILPKAKEHRGLLEANVEPLLLLGELKV